MNSIAAVIVAGGSGKRMGSDVPKQLMQINGKPLWLHCAKTFSKHPSIDTVVLVVNESFRDMFEKEVKNLPIIIVSGGKERWQSVQNGINALPEHILFALVHDAARPFISSDIISEVAKTVIESPCIVAKPVVDTVKIVEDGIIKQTIDRKNVYLAQTPQAVSVALLKELYKKMKDFPDFCPTDEASILEKFGIQMKVIEGNTQNDKITTIEDFKKAELMVL